MTELKNNDNPKFNWNNSGGPQLKKVATGAEFHSSILPVIGDPIIIEKGPDYFDAGKSVYVFKNPYKKIYDFYARVQLSGSSGWLTIPYDITTALTLAGINYMEIKTIDAEKIEFASAWAFAGVAKFEIYFVDFSI